MRLDDGIDRFGRQPANTNLRTMSVSKLQAGLDSEPEASSLSSTGPSVPWIIVQPNRQLNVGTDRSRTSEL
jgi:hypothetical protein